jgi:hypothetical protein
MEGRDRCFEEEKNNTCMDMIRLIQRSHPVAGFANLAKQIQFGFGSKKKSPRLVFTRRALRKSSDFPHQ